MNLVPKSRHTHVPNVTGPLLAVLLLLGLVEPSAGGAFDGSPAAEKSGFLVLENTYSVRLAGKYGSTDGGDFMAHWQLGYLHNVDARNAWGGALKLTADTDGYRFGPVVRYRRWLDEDTGFDVGLGAYFTGEDYSASVEFSPTVDVGFTFDDWAGIHAGVDAVSLEGSGMHVQPYIGIRFGRWLAPVTTAGLGILVGAAMASSMN